MVSSLSLIFMVISEFLALGVPIVALIYFIRKYRISWKPILIGLLIFIVFSQVLEKLLHVYVLVINPLTVEWMENPFVFAIYGGLAAGVFEEVGRFVGFRYLLKKYRDWKDGVGYGIGHGGIESLFVGGLAIGQSLIFSFMINADVFETMVQSSGGGDAAVALTTVKEQLIGQPSVYFLMGGLERVFAFALQLALSVLVLYGVRSRKLIYLLYAVLIHAAVDFLAVLAGKFGVSVYVTEGLLCVVAILSGVFIVKSKEWFAKAAGA
ncbi:MAG TPA: YhfC family glutamic-type intramembrane protease [Bacillales bacterium]